MCRDRIGVRGPMVTLGLLIFWGFTVCLIVWDEMENMELIAHSWAIVY